MPTCEDREIQLEKRAHGALDAADAVDLEAHVASCASCQAFEGLIRRVDGDLAARAAEAEKRVVWAQCERRVKREARGMQSLPWSLSALCLFVPGMFLTVLAVQVARGRPSAGIAVVSALTSVFFAWVFVAGVAIRKRWLARYRDALVSREGLFAMYREQLAEDRRGSRQTAVILLVAAAASVGVRALGPRMNALESIAPMLLAAVFVVVGLYVLFARVPRIDRQLRELG